MYQIYEIKTSSAKKVLRPNDIRINRIKIEFLHMYKKLILIVTILFLIKDASCGVLGDDPCLQKTVSLNIKGGDMADVALELSKQTGANIKIRKSIADRKITIFIDNKTLEDTLLGIKKLFRYRVSFRNTNGKMTYEFWESMKQQQDRENLWNSSYSKVLNSLESIFNQSSLILPNDEELIKERLNILENPTIRMTSFPMIDSYRSKATEVLINRLSDDVKIRLLTGITLYFDTRSIEPEWLIPEDIANVLAYSCTDNTYGIPYAESSNWDITPEYIKLSIQSNTLILSEQVYLKARAKCMIKYKSPSISKSTGDFDAFTRPIKANISVSNTNDLPYILNSSILDQRASISKEELAKASNLHWQTDPNKIQIVDINKSDLLEILHNKYGIQIISDYVSEWASFNEMKDCTIKEILDSIIKLCNPKSYWGCDQSFIYTHSIDEYSTINRETPNHILQALRSIYKQNNYFNIDALAQIALLGTDKALALEKNALYLGLANTNIVPFTIDFKDKLAILRFYGSLNKSQRQTASQDRIELSALSTEQRIYLLACFALPAYTTINNSDETITVGMYKDGIRIDKPNSQFMDNIIGIKIRKSVDMVTKLPDGSSLQESFPGYTFTIIYSDDSSTDLRLMQ